MPALGRALCAAAQLGHLTRIAALGVALSVVARLPRRASADRARARALLARHSSEAPSARMS